MLASRVLSLSVYFFFFFQAEDGIRDLTVTGVQTCALPISANGLCLRTGDECRQAAPACRLAESSSRDYRSGRSGRDHATNQEMRAPAATGAPSLLEHSRETRINNGPSEFKDYQRRCARCPSGS